MLAFMMPQDVTGAKQASQFLTTVREIENETGLDFLNEMPRELQDRVESERAPQMW